MPVTRDGAVRALHNALTVPLEKGFWSEELYDSVVELVDHLRLDGSHSDVRVHLTEAVAQLGLALRATGHTDATIQSFEAALSMYLKDAYSRKDVQINKKVSDGR